MLFIALLILGYSGTSLLYAEQADHGVRITVPSYSRERMLESAALQIEIIQSKRDVPEATKRDLIAEIVTRTDTSHYTHLRFMVRDPIAAMAFARELETKWTGSTPSGYVQALSGLAVGLLRGPPAFQDLEMSERLVRGSFERLPEVPTQVAVGALLRFSKDWEVASGHRLVPMDWIPREAALDAYVRVLTDVNAVLKSINSNAYDGLTEREAQALGSGVLPETFAGLTNRLDVIREFVKRREMLKEREFYDTKSGKELDSDPWGGHEEKLHRAFTNHIHRHYTLSPADLDEVQVALEKYVKDPALKERLILAAYKGTNPFLGRTVNAKTVAVGGAQTSSSTGGIAAKHGAAAKPSTPTASQTVSGRRTEGADTLPLATTSGVSPGQGALWLGFAGAAALIVLVLWRAQTRGASGGPK
ncbi:MAG: hypothetical protein B9S33_15965 [Pedosphaera sp. Tous-C6FEB]|nr:MAG: hypothetical protein B9S33_15965 [Pedosphaera sp. Tous-C6FEB]